MSRYEINFTLRTPSVADRWACRRRGIKPPLMMTATRVGELMMLALPYRWRRAHHWYATSRGYFWIPCPICGHEFGGHEIGGSQALTESSSRCICRPCTNEVTRA